MAEVHIVDIDGERWDIKDLQLTERVAALEDAISVKKLQSVYINMASGYSTKIRSAGNHYSVGKIHFISILFNGLRGDNIGTYNAAAIGQIDLRPAEQTEFFLFDYTSNRMMRCYLRIDGFIVVAKSYGVKQGDNDCYGQLIFAEA